MIDFVEGEGDDEFDPQTEDRAVEAIEKAQAAEAEQVEQALRRLREAYKRVFAGNPMGDDVNVVMTDLAYECFGFASTYHVNPREHARREGRREVFQRILDFTDLPSDTLRRLYLTKMTGT